MQQLPTTDEQARAEQDAAKIMGAIGAQSKVTRALASIERAKRGTCPEVARALDSVADLIRASGDPDAVYDRVIERLAQEDLTQLAAAHKLRLLRSSVESVAEGAISHVVLFPDFAVLPHGQKARDSLSELRSAIAERLAEQRLAADFQASVAAGHTESVEDW